MKLPYVGPRAFQRGEQLYGRRREVRDLQRLLTAERIVTLHSPSGAGKTSLIQAVLIPELERRRFHVLPIIRINTGSSSPDPQSLTADLRTSTNRYVLSALLSLEEGVPDAQQIPLDELAQMRLSNYLDHRARVDGRSADTVLIFDQFEEILTIEPTNVAAKQAFFEQVGEALEHRQRWALFALREEFLAALDPYVRVIPNRLKDTFRLGLLGVAAAKQAIQEPARQEGVDFTDAAAAILLDDLRQVQVQQPDGTLVAQPGPSIEPVQLQVVCLRLWATLPPAATRIDEEAVNALGDVNTALADYYAERVAAAAAETGIPERAIRDWVDQHLITGQGIRGQVAQGIEESEGLSNAAIQHLTAAHLVRAEQRRGVTWYELAHDRLVEPVQHNNKAWYETNLTTLQRQAELWEQEHRSEGLLLRDDPLREAEAWAAVHADEMTEGEQAFLAACRLSRKRQEQELQKKRIIFMLGLGALIMVIGLAYFLFQFFSVYEETIQRGRHIIELKEKAEAQGLAFGAQSTLDDAPEFALLLAIEAAERGRSPLVEGMLHKAVRGSPVRQRLQGHTNVVMQAAYSPDGQRIVSASADTTARVWDATTGEEVLLLEGHTDRVNDAAFSPDGQRIATASADTTARVWDATTGEVLLLEGHTDDVASVAFSPGGQRIVTASWDGTARVWDATTGEEVLRLAGHSDQVFDATFSPDGERIATASWDGTARVWDATTGEEVLLLEGHEGGVWVAAFSPDGQRIATASYDGTARVWDAATGEEVLNIEGNADGAGMSGVAFSPDGQHIVTINWGDTARVWDATWGEQLSVLRGHEGNVNSAAYRPDGRRIVTTDESGSVWVWAAQPGEEVLSLSHTTTVWSAAFSPDGQRVVTASGDSTAVVWDVATGDATAVLEGHEGSVYSARFSPDGRQILAAGSDSTARLWDAASGVEMQVLPHNEVIYSAVFSPDGQRIATASADRTVTVWDAAAGVQVMTLSGHRDNVVNVVFSPDGQRIVSASADMTARVWDAASGEELLTLEGHTDWVNDAAFSPDGQRIVTASSDQTARVWDATTGEVVITLEGHEGEVYGVAFSPDGQYIVTAGWDETARLWEVESGEEIVRLEYASRLHDVAFSPDGRLVVTAGEDGTAHLSYTDFADVLDLARQRVTRSLTEEERRLYLGEK